MLSYLADRYPFSSFIPALWNRSPTRAVARFHPQYQSRCLARWTCNSHMFNVHIFCAHLHFTPSFAGLSVSPLVRTPDDLSNIVLSLYMYCLRPSTNIHLAIQKFPCVFWFIGILNVDILNPFRPSTNIRPAIQMFLWACSVFALTNSIDVHELAADVKVGAVKILSSTRIQSKRHFWKQIFTYLSWLLSSPFCTLFSNFWPLRTVSMWFLLRFVI